MKVFFDKIFSNIRKKFWFSYDIIFQVFEKSFRFFSLSQLQVAYLIDNRHLICSQIRYDPRVRRENRKGRAGTGRLARCEDLPGGHYLSLVRQIHQLQGRTEATQARREQAHCCVSVQAKNFATGAYAFAFWRKSGISEQNLPARFVVGDV